MIVVSQNLFIDLSWAHLFVILLILSNVFLHFVRQEILTRPSFYSVVAFGDVLLITAALVISGQTATDFYMMYFLVIIISALSQQLNRIVISAVLVILLYGLSLLWTTYDKITVNPTLLLRFPFFFIIALFFGYLVQSVRQEKLHREQLGEEDVNRLKAQFLRLITHELLRPINVILTHIHLLLTASAGQLSLKQIQLVDHLQLHAEKLCGLIRDLVDLSNIEARKTILQVKKGTVGSFFQEIQREILPQLKDRSLTVEFLSEEDLPSIETDWNKLGQTILYILANAIKFTPPGQITVIACKGPGENQVTFGVADAGVGIGKEDVPAIFEELTKAAQTDGQEGGGLAVGLVMAKNMVEILGGAVQVRNRVKNNPDIAITMPTLWNQKPKEVIEISYAESDSRRTFLSEN